MREGKLHAAYTNILSACDICALMTIFTRLITCKNSSAELSKYKYVYLSTHAQLCGNVYEECNVVS